MIQRCLDGLQELIGREKLYSRWLPIDQERIDRFAEVTGDHQWVHVDVERARREAGGTIAHGFLTLSLIPELAKETLVVTGVAFALNYGLDRVRFPAPLPSGTMIRLVHEIIDCAERPDRFISVTHGYTVECSAVTKPVCVAVQVILYRPQ